MVLADLDRALAQDIATLGWELERARTLVALSANGYELKNTSEDMRADRSVVLAAVQQCGEALRFASNELVSDRVVVLAAVLENPRALRFAALQFEGAKHIVMAAVQQDPEVMEYVDAAFKRDPQILLHALSSCTVAVPVIAGDVLEGGVIAGDVLEGGPAEAPNFLRSIDQQLFAQLDSAMVEWLKRLIASGDEEAAHRLRLRQQDSDARMFTLRAFSGADYAGWATSKFDRRRAVMVLYRSDPFCQRSPLATLVLKFL